MSKAKPFIIEDYVETFALKPLTAAIHAYLLQQHPDMEKIFHQACAVKDHQSNTQPPLAHLCLTFHVFPPCSTRIQTPYPIEGSIFSGLEAGQKMCAFIDLFCQTFSLPNIKPFSDVVRDYENPYRTRLRLVIPSAHVDDYLKSMNLDPSQDWSK
ncbi:MAG: hypothetical protein K0R63_995 [Rickettsiales bacterium]|nr:hypothetical protein [Rickettsiales bacterium]